ncbi:MAG: hypothetical protein ABIY55_25810 [Kofleriaceae bacterium]
MRSHPLGVVLALALALPGCTVVGIGVASGTTGIHNAAVDPADQWGYTTPILIGATIGLIADIVFLKFLQHQWAKPMT